MITVGRIDDAAIAWPIVITGRACVVVLGRNEGDAEQIQRYHGHSR